MIRSSLFDIRYSVPVRNLQNKNICRNRVKPAIYFRETVPYRNTFGGCCTQGILAHQEIGLIHAVNQAVLWHGSASELRERRESVHFVNDFIAHTAGGNLPPPADDERRPGRAFHVREILATPRAGTALMRKRRVGVQYQR